MRKLSNQITCARYTKDAREAIKQLKNNQPKESNEKPRTSVKLLNIAFSKDGIKKLGFNPEELQDKDFPNGQLHDAQELGDPGKTDSGRFVPDWDPVFQSPIDGLILVATDSDDTTKVLIKEIDDIFGTTVKKVYVLTGTVRTPAGQEVSAPCISGLNTY